MKLIDGKIIMKSHKDNLERLANKWQARYGEQDPIVIEVKYELARLELNHSNLPECAFVATEPKYPRRYAARIDAQIQKIYP